MVSLGAHVSPLPSSPPHAPLVSSRPSSPSPTAPAAVAANACAPRSLCFLGHSRIRSHSRSSFAAERTRRPTMAAAISLEAGGGLAHDLGSAAITAGVALALLKFFEELAKRGVFEQKLGRKLVHISVGLVFLLFWPLFSSGIADVVGRRLGKEKLPYNPNKSYAGSIAMALAGFLASVGYMHYFHTFGFIEETWYMALGFLVVSIAATLVESHPISTELDDNLTVPLTSFLVGSLIF